MEIKDTHTEEGEEVAVEEEEDHQHHPFQEAAGEAGEVEEVEVTCHHRLTVCPSYLEVAEEVEEEVVVAAAAEGVLWSTHLYVLSLLAKSGVRV